MIAALCRGLLLATAFVLVASAPTAGAAAPASLADAAAGGEQRVALVIGNGRYASSPLLNPVNDARAIAAVLRKLRFNVTLLEDADLKQMAEAARNFGDALQKGGTGLFYYAGHGMQIKGRNYLIPVGADIQREDEVSFTAFDAGQLLDKMESARNRVNIVILDACRNNPFSRSFRSASQGLAQMEAPAGTYLSFATAPGKVASDGADGKNGLYTQHLLEAMQTPGLKIEEVFKKVRVKVIADSTGQQVPWDNSSLAGDFYFAPTNQAGGDAPAEEATAETATKSTASGTAPALALSTARATTAADEKPSASAPDKATGTAPAAPGKATGIASGADRAPAAGAARGKRDERTLLASAAPALANRAPAAPKPAAPAEATNALYRTGTEAKSRGDLTSAVEALGRAADAGHPAAAYELGVLLKAGRKPVTQDLPRAHRLFLHAAELGNAAGQYELAQSFAQGTGTTKNCAEAAKWSRRAADAGLPDAAALFGDLNLSGCGGTKNPEEAARWLRVAADKGLPGAQFSLGVLYMNGDGVAKSAADARKWLTSAAASGNTSAKFYLDRLGN